MRVLNLESIGRKRSKRREEKKGVRHQDFDPILVLSFGVNPTA
jgi:hypothetical protein